MNDIDVSLVGDKELLNMLRELDYKTQQTYLKRVLRDTAQKTYVRKLRKESPVKSGNLKASFGYVTGKSKRVATVFAGPRMGGKYKGYIANVIEYNKGVNRYPVPDKRGGEPKKRPMTPFGVRVHSGIMTTRPFIKRTIENTMPEARDHIFKSVRTVIERAVKRWAKRT